MNTEIIPNVFRNIGTTDLRSKIEDLESVMLKMEERRIHIEPKHYFCDGFYAREILIPKGTTLTGKIHKFEHINIVSKGVIDVLTEGGIERIEAPCTIISQPGIKRVGYAHEDTIWTTFHKTEETNPETIEDFICVNTRLQFEAFMNKSLEEF